MGLLEILAGCWVSVFVFRRPLMCLLQHIYAARRGRSRNDVLRLSQGFLSELLLLAILAPLAVTDLRAPPTDFVYAGDASNWGTAHVRAPLPHVMAKELCRHVIARGVWTKLLTPYQRWMKTHGLLALDDEVPGEAIEAPAPLWADVVRALTFIDRQRGKYRGRRPHINIGEVRASLEALRDAGRTQPNSRVLLGSDSQVALGALVKGRSSSTVLNQELERGLPDILGSNLYIYAFWIWTLLNPADDGTRGLAIRGPSAPLPPWWHAVLDNDYSIIDEVVAKKSDQNGDASLAELSGILESGSAVRSGEDLGKGKGNVTNIGDARAGPAYLAYGPGPGPGTDVWEPSFGGPELRIWFGSPGPCGVVHSDASGSQVKA